MNNRITDDSEQIDRKTSRSICEAVGKQLQHGQPASSLRPSSDLERLMDELRRQDSENHRNSSN